MFAWISKLAAHPAVGPVLTALACVTAFTAGMVYNIGFALLPVIDKADLLFSLTFYAGVLSVAFRMLVLWASSAEIPTLARQFAERFLRKLPRLLSKGLIAIVLLLAGVLLVRIFLGSPPLAVFLGSAASAAVVGFGLWRGGVSAAAPFTPMMITSMLQLQFLVTVALGGYVWADTLRSLGPRAVITFVDPEMTEQPVSIVSTSTTGVLVFYPGDRATHVVPWSSIKTMRTLDISMVDLIFFSSAETAPPSSAASSARAPAQHP